MSDTPKTDAFEALVNRPTNWWDFARELERENAALRADKERLDWLSTYEGGLWIYWAIENGEWTPEVAASRAAIDSARKEAQP